MNITEINFAMDILRHPQSGDEADIEEALNIAIKSLKICKERLSKVVEREDEV